MTSGFGTFLVDTNVLVYAYDPRDAAKRERAVMVLDRLAAHQAGVLSAQILGEFFVVVTRKIPSPLSVAEAERSVTNYVHSWGVLDVTAVIAQEAMRGVRRHRLPYWDSLIWATAKLNGVTTVLSEDFRAGALIESVRFLDPFARTFDLALLPPG